MKKTEINEKTTEVGGKMLIQLRLVMRAKDKKGAVEVLRLCGMKNPESYEYSLVDKEAYIVGIYDKNVNLSSRVGEKMLGNNVLILYSAEMDKYRRDMYVMYSELEQKIRGLLMLVLSNSPDKMDDAALMGLRNGKANRSRDNAETLYDLTLTDLFSLMSVRYKDNYLRLFNADDVISIIDESRDFEEYRKIIKNRLSPRTVWDDICDVLRNPCQLSVFEEESKKIINARNKVAHSKNIFNEDYINFKKSYERIISIIDLENVKTGDDLAEALSSISESLRPTIEAYGEAMRLVARSMVPSFEAYNDAFRRIADALATQRNWHTEGGK